MNKVKDKIDLLYIDPSENFGNIQQQEQDQTNFNIKTIFPSEKADYIIFNNIKEMEDFSLNYFKTLSAFQEKEYESSLKLDLEDNQHALKQFGIHKKVNSNKDIEEIKTISEKGANFVIIDVEDWKIIPLENIIASLQKTHTEIFALAKSVEEVETLFTVLELGVDGIIIETESEEDIIKIKNFIRKIFFNITPAKILEIKDIGIGERVCIDTVSMLTEGEGMLIGNKSNFLFLVHNESIGSSYTSPRPFRVNAGAVHCYTITPDGTTKYLSELESGSQVLIVNSKGLTRTVSVGRSKIETRPLRLFKAVCENEVGTIIVQNAETIRFLDKNEGILPVTHAKIGDEILVFSRKSSGRHFGMEVADEYILER
ncbi:MAG: 3-dehydroquinate synthase [Nitrosopumilus sp.]|nr:3-dehydroquinate synthase [Nitrosopumilus sp.]